MCSPSTGAHNATSIVLLSTILAIHVLIMGSKLSQRNYNGTVMKWRIFYPGAGMPHLTAAFNVAYLLILVISAAIFVVHVYECPKRSCQDLSMRITAKAHVVIHLMRILCTVRNVVFQWSHVRTRSDLLPTPVARVDPGRFPELTRVFVVPGCRTSCL